MSSDMKTPLSARGRSARQTVEGMVDDHKKFVKEAGGDLKRAKEYNNCISPAFPCPKYSFSIIRVTYNIIHLLSTSGVFTWTAHDTGDLPEDIYSPGRGLPPT